MLARSRALIFLRELNPASSERCVVLHSRQRANSGPEYFQLVMGVLLMDVTGLVAGQRHPHFLADASVR